VRKLVVITALTLYFQFFLTKNCTFSGFFLPKESVHFYWIYLFCRTFPFCRFQSNERLTIARLVSNVGDFSTIILNPLTKYEFGDIFAIWREIRQVNNTAFGTVLHLKAKHGFQNAAEFSESTKRFHLHSGHSRLGVRDSGNLRRVPCYRDLDLCPKEMIGQS